MADSKKLSFSTTTISQYFFAKILGIGPWVSRNNWCEEHGGGYRIMKHTLGQLGTKKENKTKQNKIKLSFE